MAENDEQNMEYVDALEQEIFQHEAFLHKKGILKEFEKWLGSPEHEDDLREYEKIVQQEAESIDASNMTMDDSE